MEIFICGHAMKKEYGSYCRHIGGAENEQPGYSTSSEQEAQPPQTKEVR